MIPQFVLGVALVAGTLEVVSSAASAGTGYGLGRKYGRKLCNAMDQMESTIATSLNKLKN